jgi:hypothetical protein
LRRKRATSKIKGPKVAFADLGLIVFCGNADDTELASPKLENAFLKGFNHRTNNKSWKVVGVVPLT